MNASKRKLDKSQLPAKWEKARKLNEREYRANKKARAKKAKAETHAGFSFGGFLRNLFTDSSKAARELRNEKRHEVKLGKRMRKENRNRSRSHANAFAESHAAKHVYKPIRHLRTDIPLRTLSLEDQQNREKVGIWNRLRKAMEASK